MRKLPTEIIYLIMQYCPAYGLHPRELFSQKIKLKTFSIIKYFISGIHKQELVQIKKIIFNSSLEDFEFWTTNHTFTYVSKYLFLNVFPEKQKFNPSYFIIFY